MLWFASEPIVSDLIDWKSQEVIAMREFNLVSGALVAALPIATLAMAVLSQEALAQEALAKPDTTEQLADGLRAATQR